MAFAAELELRSVMTEALTLIVTVPALGEVKDVSTGSEAVAPSFSVSVEAVPPAVTEVETDSGAGPPVGVGVAVAVAVAGHPRRQRSGRANRG